MFSCKVINKILEFYNGKPLIIEGANGSIGLSFLYIFKEYSIKPSPLILSTYASKLDDGWLRFDPNIIHIKASEEGFSKKRSSLLKKMKHINVIYCSGYGRPGIFLNDPKSVINTNISNLVEYSEIENISSFAYMSTSELYSGLEGEANEDSILPTSPQHPRGVYIESKRLGEAIVENIIGNNVPRVASYRVALAFPPKLLDRDNRVMADLIQNAWRDGVVTLNGGESYIRQYQYGPNCARKILASMALGSSTLYNNSGSHIITLGDLARLIGEILGLNVKIKETSADSSAPRSVLVNSQRLNTECNYQTDQELSLAEYITEMINGKSI